MFFQNKYYILLYLKISFHQDIILLNNLLMIKENLMEYIKEEMASCPKNHREATHTLTYKKATCTRVPDTLLHFMCSLNPRCKVCVEEYL